MRIDHIALWVEDLEKMKNFYIKYFKAMTGEKYVNAAKGFSSYFLEFGIGLARIELMHRHDVFHTGHKKEKTLGLAHFAIGLAAEELVYTMTEKLRADGYTVIGEPRVTGDGYLESIVLDPEGNTLELTV